MRPLAAAAAAGLLGSALALAAGLAQQRANEQHAHERFDALALRVVDQLTRRLQIYEYGLRGARGTVIASGVNFVDRATYERYAESRQITREFPGAHGIGLVRRVPAAREAAFVANARQDGWPDFTTRQLAPHDGDRYLIQYIEPVPRNREAIGLDIASEPRRREAADRAAETGDPAISAPVTLVQAADRPQRGFLLLMPIYLAGSVPVTAEERRAASSGWAYMPLVIDEVLRGFEQQDGEFRLTLTDMTDGTAEVFHGAAGDAAAPLARTLALPLYGRAWQAELRATPVFFDNLDATDPRGVAALGFALALMAAAAAYFRALGLQRSRSVEAEHRRRAAIVEASHDAILGVDLEGRITDWNRSAERMFGYTSAEALGRSVAGLLLPQDRLAEDARMRAGIARGERVQAFESVRRTAAGGLVEVAITASPVHDAAGTLIGFSKTLRDITEAKHAERRLRELADDLERQVEERTAMLDRTGRLARVGGWSLDMEVGEPEWSDETCRIHDLPPGHRPTLAEAIGYYTPEARPVISAAVETGIASGEGWDLELPLVTATGRSIRVRAIGEVELRPDGRKPRLFGAFQDVSKRYVLEAELGEMRERFATAALDAGIGMWEWRVSSDTLVWDEGMYRINGVERRDGEDLTRRWRSTMHPDDLAASRAALDAALAGKPVAATEFRIVRPGGEVRHVRSSVRVSHDPAGRPLVMTGVNVDITERKRAEEALRAVHERFSIAAEAAAIGVWEWDTPSNTLVWDDGMYRLYGRERAGAREPFALWVESVHPDDIERCRTALQAAADGGPAYEVEFRVLRPDGEVRHVRSAAQRTLVQAGRARRMTGINIDITALKTAELERRDTSALLRNVLDAASEMAITAIGPDLVVRLFNRGAERMLGYTSAEVVGRHTPDLFHDRDELIAMTKQRSRELGRRLRPGELMTGPEILGRSREFTYVAKDGRRLPVALTVTAMRGDDGEPIGYMGMAYDVTPQKAAEATLRMAKARAELANQAKSQFLANMSHEIRTPMNAVINLAYLLAQSPLDAAQRELLDKVQFASRSLLGVINDILDLSKIEAGELAIERAPIALPALLQELGEVMALQAEAKGIAFAVSLPDDLPRAVRSDAVRLQQILTNLLSNAIKFTEEGSVGLAVTRVEGAPGGSERLRFAVRDTGPGIAPGVQSRLFAPFAQADTSITRRFGGSGLGLSIVKRLAQLMGGQVGVQSSLGAGSEFWVELPLAHADVAELPPAPERAPRPGRALYGTRLLVVDDSAINLEVAQRILALEGAQVTLAENGREALACLRADPTAFDAVVMDVQMPVMDGYEATRLIRAEPVLRGMPVIALTAGALTSERQRATEAGMDDFVTKPFEARALVACIRRHVGAKVIAAASSDSVPGELAPLLPARPRAGDWPVIDGIDLADVRARLADDVALFASTLRRVLAEFADLSRPPVGPPPDATALAALRARMHRLRGSAGLLGANGVAEQAHQVELACEQGDAAEAARRGAPLSAAFERLRLAVAAAGPLTPAPAPDAAVPPLDAAAVAELQRLLAQQSLIAIDAFEALAPAFAQRYGRDACEALRAHIDDLQFAQAQAVLQPLAAQGVANGSTAESTLA